MSLPLTFLLLVLLFPSALCTQVCVAANGASRSDNNPLNSVCDEQVLAGLNDAVHLMNQSNTELFLLPGNHTLSAFTIMESVANISIVGLGTRETVELTCEEDVGLAFVNVRNLIIHKITITNCGIRNENMVAVSQRAEEYVLLNHTYVLLPSIRRAVFVAECYDLSLEHVRIRNTVGVGLTALNIHGNSYIRNVEFYNNSHSDNLTDEQAGDYVAGGVMFYFGNSLKHDSNTVISGTKHNLVIDSCRFMRSTSIAHVTRHILVDDFFEISDFRNKYNDVYRQWTFSHL